MARLFLVLIGIFVTLACKEHQAEKDCILDHNDVKFNKEFEVKPFANPVLIYGTSFGEYFQILYKQNRFDEMIRLTSKQTIQKFGEQSLRNFYETKFRFDYQLGKVSAKTSSGDTVKLIYANASILGTNRKVTLPIVIENDTAKLVLTNLKNAIRFIDE